MQVETSLLEFGRGRAGLGARISHDRWQIMKESLRLTERELDIVRHLFDGERQAEIGRALGISEHTVHTHIGRMYRKLGVRGLPEMLLQVFSAYIAGEPSAALSGRLSLRPAAASGKR